MNFLTKKIGPLPVWGYGVIVLTGVGYVLYKRKQEAAAAAATAAATQAGSTTAATTAASTPVASGSYGGGGGLSAVAQQLAQLQDQLGELSTPVATTPVATSTPATATTGTATTAVAPTGSLTPLTSWSGAQDLLAAGQSLYYQVPGSPGTYLPVYDPNPYATAPLTAPGGTALPPGTTLFSGTPS